MENNDSKNRLRTKIRNKIQELSRDELTHAIANAIGERRTRDLLDLLIGIEIKHDWKRAVNQLRGCMNCNYQIPPFTGNRSRPIEPLKYREVIFSLFGCKGIEAINIPTEGILASIEATESIALAETRFMKDVQDHLNNHLKASNLLFMDVDLVSTCLQSNTIRMIESGLLKNIESVSIPVSSDTFDITALWHTEYGRIALSKLGIRGTEINKSEFEMVLSVLPVSQGIEKRTRSNETKDPLALPLNPDYQPLLTGIINHDTNLLTSLGSRHAIPLMNFLLEESIDNFRELSTSTSYSEMTRHLFNHTFIRSVESLPTLEKSAHSSNERISSLAITALSNFYHDSSVAILVSVLCSTRNDTIKKIAMESLKRINRKLPETIPIIQRMLQTEYQDCSSLKQLLNEFTSR